MEQLRPSRQLIKMWHRGEKATIDHLVRSLADPASAPHTIHSAYTSSGVSIEDQIRKAWRPDSAGLAMF